VKVITAGSGRIAEVAARFTLDAMPGKQLAIDADLNNGLIDEKEAAEAEAKVGQIYRSVLRRDPDADELALGTRYLSQAEADTPPQPAWQYGYGTVDLGWGSVESFTPLPRYDDKKYMGNGGKLPDEDLGWTSLTPGGGHPGEGSTFAAIARWVAPEAGTLQVKGFVGHASDKGEGVRAVMGLQGSPPLYTQHVFNDRDRFRARDVAVSAGDILDFAVHCGRNTGFDSFGLEYELVLETPDGRELVYDYAEDFDSPPPPAMKPDERLAHVLLMSNEFMFID